MNHSRSNRYCSKHCLRCSSLSIMELSLNIRWALLDGWFIETLISWLTLLININIILLLLHILEIKSLFMIIIMNSTNRISNRISSRISSRINRISSNIFLKLILFKRNNKTIIIRLLKIIIKE